MDESNNRSTLAGLATVLVVLGVLLGAGRLFHGQSPMVGHDAPAFTLSLVANGGDLGADGASLNASQLRGHAVLLDFWATWCRYCRAELPAVDALSKRWRDKGLVVVGVSTDRPEEGGDPGRYARAHGMTFPIVSDSSGAASRAYGIESLPTVVVLSSAGKVVAVHTGVAGDDELDRLISSAL
jgi:cytochrome c biogenesis protein CcmG, thiol:disulfide interchange protein DsbE